MKRKNNFYLSLSLIYFFAANFIFAQDLSFINYNTKDGLSSSQVYNIFQDKNGNILFATDRGITKFDGYKFETYSKENGLTNTTVFKFFPQANGTIWCSTIDNSWFYFKNGSTNFTPSPINNIIQKSSKGGQADDLWIENDDIYIGFESISDFLRINKKTKEVIHPITSISRDPDSLSAVFVFSGSKVFKYYERSINNSNIWPNNKTLSIKQSYAKLGYKKSDFINNKGLFSSNSYLKIVDENGNEKELDLGSKIIGLGKFDDSHFWVGILEEGIKIFDMSGNEKYHWLKGKSPSHLFKDKNEGIWISTLENGVYYAQNDKLHFYSTGQNSYIHSISPGENQSPLISTISNYFIVDNFQLKPVSSTLAIPTMKLFYNHFSQTYGNLVTSAYFIDDKKIYNAKTAVIDFTENLELPFVTSAPFSFSVYRNGVYHTYPLNSRITAIENADKGAIIGGYNGLYFYSFENTKTTKFNLPAITGRITDIKIKGRFHFIGTNENGIVRYYQKGNKFLHIDKKHGLASNLINEVYAESESVLWVATNNGLDRVTFFKDKYAIKHFGKEHGLIDNDVTDVYIHNNTIWIGTRSGLLSLSKSNFENISKSIQLNLLWNRVQINNRNINYLKNSVLSHDQNNLEFEFHSAFFGGTSRVQYRYKIDNSKDSWHLIKNRSITLNNLNPGKYKIILQANVDNTNWIDNQLTTSFTIKPPYYQTWWFRSIAIALIIFLIYLFFRFRVLIYNKSLVKEALRLLIRKLNPQLKSFVIIEQGKKLRINSMDILYFKSQGNYLDIHLKDHKHTIRHKIGEIDSLVPDKIEYLRVNKSFVVRIDKITGKNIDSIFIDKIEIPIGSTFKKTIKELDI